MRQHLRESLQPFAECVAIWNYKDTRNTDTSQSLSWCVQHMTSEICRALYNSVERNTERTADFTNSQCECSSRVALATVGSQPWFLLLQSVFHVSVVPRRTTLSPILHLRHYSVRGSVHSIHERFVDVLMSSHMLQTITHIVGHVSLCLCASVPGHRLTSCPSSKLIHQILQLTFLQEFGLVFLQVTNDLR